MRKLATLAAAGAILAACVSAPDDTRSCAELAQARAAGQMERDTAMLEQHETGLSNQSDLQRKLIALDAEEYRAAVYEECRRRRGFAVENE